jgi:hypothetical protein
VHGLARLVLSALPGRTGVISFYRRPATPTPSLTAAESPVPMVYMERSSTGDDSLSIRSS